MCLSTVPKLTAAMNENGCVDEEQMSTQQLDASYGPLRELVSESVHQQETVLERVQVSPDKHHVHVSYCAAVNEHVNAFRLLLTMQLFVMRSN